MGEVIDALSAHDRSLPVVIDNDADADGVVLVGSVYAESDAVYIESR